ncbi:MAG: TadE family type IV pilus minor pilin [Acidimicrobiia bacterium]
MGVPRGRERGQATVEFALVLPILVLALLAVLQVALVVRDHIAVVHAAREAARAASVDPDPSRAVRAARRTLPGARVHVGRRGRVGEPITVVVTYRSSTELPLVGPLFPDPTLRSRVVMRVEK